MWTIVELKEKLSNGLVPHNVDYNGQLLGTNMAYDDARDLVAQYMKPGERLTEVYQSSGRSVEYSFDEFMDERKVHQNWLNDQILKTK